MEKMNRNKDLVLLREILARELETINNYQANLYDAQSPEVIDFISHIIDEEKEHVAEAMELINRLDERQAVRFNNSAHWRSDAGSPPETDRGHTPANKIGSLTVGSLRK